MTSRESGKNNNELTILVFAGHRTEKLADPLRRADANVIIVSDTSSSLLTRGVRAAIAGQRQLRKYDVDVVVGDHAGVVSFVAALIASVFKTSFVLRLGGNIWEINKEKYEENIDKSNYSGALGTIILIILNKLTFLLCDGYLSISETVTNAIINNTEVAPDKIGHIGVPLDYNAFSNTSSRDQFPPDDSAGNLLITVINLRFQKKYKAISEVLTEIKQVMLEQSDLKYVIAGDGTYLNPLQEDINTVFPEQIQDRVYCVGFVDDVASLYAAADAMIYVSYSEGFGNIIQEAMAAGCPIVANDHEGLAEQIKDNETGILVTSPSDPKMSDAIKRALYDPDRERIITNAQEYVQSVSDPKTIGDEIITELQVIINESKR